MSNPNDIIFSLMPQFFKKGFPLHRITPSEESMCVIFKKESIFIYIEFYYDGDIGIIAEDYAKKKIIFNEDVLKEDVVDKVEKILIQKKGTINE